MASDTTKIVASNLTVAYYAKSSTGSSHGASVVAALTAPRDKESIIKTYEDFVELLENPNRKKPK